MRRKRLDNCVVNSFYWEFERPKVKKNTVVTDIKIRNNGNVTYDSNQFSSTITR